MDDVASRQDALPAFALWLILAGLLHLFVMLQFPLRLQTAYPVPIETSPVIAVELRRLLPAPEPAPALPETPGQEPRIAPVNTHEPPKAADPLPRSKPGQPDQPQAIAESRPEPAGMDASRLKQAVRDYRLPEWDERKHFSPMLPEGVSAETFSANTLVRNNYRVQAYDGHGGARVMRFSQFGKKDRCFLVHRAGFEIEREDWDPGMDTVIGWGAEEVPCE